MNKALISVGCLFGLLLFVFISFLACCTRVDPGYVGIKVNLYGNQKGVEDFPLQTGRVWYNPFTEEVYEYPTFMQNQAWTSSETEGSKHDESITFNSIEGSSINVDVGLNYTLDAEKVPHLFVEFRQDIETITHGYLRNQVRDALSRIGGNYKAIEIFGEKKQQLLDEVKNELDNKLKDKGFILDTVSFISAPQADSRVMQSINMVIEATQKAIEAENKVRQIEAEAEQEVARANGAAKAILTEAEAQAQANKLIAESITPELVKYKLLEKWDGIAPKVLGGDSELLLSVGAE